jgi:hypothetical protein
MNKRLNEGLLVATANKVSDEDSVILFEILNQSWNESKHDTIYALALCMLEELEGEEE